MPSARVIDPEFLVALPASSSVMSLSEDTCRAPHMPRPRLLWSASMVRSCGICPKTCYRQFFQQCLSAHHGICNLQHRPLQAGAVLRANSLPPINQDSPLSRGISLFVVELLCIHASRESRGPTTSKWHRQLGIGRASGKKTLFGIPGKTRIRAWLGVILILKASIYTAKGYWRYIFPINASRAAGNPDFSRSEMDDR